MEDIPPTKSPSFHKGMITRMKLVNFMTYEKVYIHAQPKLNILIGPNGTGKSTFLCAVILGLGGKPSVIGRSTNLTDYIKRGCKESKIMIELYNPDGNNYVITRKLFANSSSSSWELQGKPTNYKKISELTEKLNIHINNLCMLLPQDRVQDFAKMNKKQLLEHTQKSVGDGSMFELYEKLCEIRSKMKEQNNLLKEKTKNYEVEMQLFKRMEVDVKSYRERKKALNKIELMKKKESWLQYEEKNTNVEQVMKDYNTILKEYEEVKELLKPFVAIIKEGEKEESVLSKKIIKQNELVTQEQTKQMDLKKKFLKIKNTVATLKDDLNAKIEAEKKKTAEIENLKTKIKQTVDSAPAKSESVLIEEINKVEKETEELVQRFSQARLNENEFRNVNAKTNQHVKAIEHKINQAESVNDKKLAILQNFKNVNEAYIWLREKHEEFFANIFGPLFMELNVKNSKHAKYVEKIIPHRDLIAFVCEDYRDATKLLKMLRDNRHLKINALNSPPINRDLKEIYPSPYPINMIKKFGFHSYLIDLIEGPSTILNYLCSQLGFHKIPVGSDEVIKHADEIPTNIKLFFSENKMFQSRISHYSGERLQTVRVLDEARFLGYSMNFELLKSLNKEKEDYIKVQRENHQKEAEISEMKKKLEIELNHARNSKRDLCRELEFIKSSNVRLRMKREELERLQTVIFDREAVETTTKEKIAENILNVVEINTAYHNTFKECHNAQIAASLIQLQLDALLTKIKSDERHLKNRENQSLKLKEKAEKMKSEVVKAKTEAKLFYKKAKELTDGLDPDNPEFLTRYNVFKHFSNKLEELQENIGESEALIRCQQGMIDDKVIKDYDDKKLFLDRLGKHLESLRIDLSVSEQKCQELKNKWLPKITNFVTFINDKFSQSFSFLGCAGAVELDQGENREEFENYGLNIKVRFRNDSDMLILDPYKQSGGEKALSIAVYLLSMQNVIKVPFRWVDEINQGMDAYNELRVYFLMMCEIADDPAAQYFIITPKLVSGFRTTLETTIHVIFSGEFEKKDSDSIKSPKSPKIRKNCPDRIKWSKAKFFEHLGINMD